MRLHRRNGAPQRCTAAPEGKDAGLLRGRDGHAPRPVHRRRAGRGRHRRRRDRCCPAIGFALGPVFEEEDVGVAGRRTDERLHAPTTTPPVTITLGSGTSARPARRPRTCARRNAELDGERAGRVHRDLDPLRPPRLSGALGERRRSGSSVPATAASTTPRRGRGRAARAPARPVRDPRPERPGPDRPALQRQLGAEALLRRATRASRSTACGSTSTRSVSGAERLGTWRSGSQSLRCPAAASRRRRRSA